MTHTIEIGVFQGRFCRDSRSGLVQEEFGDQIDAVLVQSGRAFHQRLGRIKRKIVIGQFLGMRNSGPSVLGGRAQDFKDEMEFVLDGRSREERSSGGHFVENATHAPHVDGGRIVDGAQQDVRRPVPKGYHFVGVGLRRDGFRSGQSEIGQLHNINMVVILGAAREI